MDTLPPGQSHIPDEWKNTQNKQENEKSHEDEPQRENTTVIKNLIEEMNSINTRIKNMEKRIKPQSKLKIKLKQ